MNILMLSSTVPYPPSRGGTEVRTYHLLAYLQQCHRVTLVTQPTATTPITDLEALRQRVGHLVTFPQGEIDRGKGWGQKAKRWAIAQWQGRPPNVQSRYNPQMQQWVTHQICTGRYDVLTSEHSVNAVYVQPAFRAWVNPVLNVHSLASEWTRDHLITGASSHPWRDRLYLPTLIRYERRFGRQFSTLVVTTTDEAQRMQARCPASEICVVPNGVDLAAFPARRTLPGGQRLIFTGAMDSSHNIDAVQFFVREVWPVVRQRYAAATLTIAGDRPTSAVLQLAEQPGVTVTGRVASLADLLHQSTICVLPLRTGLGIKNKTLEAMAAGVPVVGSDRALEGLTVDGDGVPLRALRANQVSDYLDAIGRLFDSPELQWHLATQARAMIEQQFTWEHAGQRYEAVLRDGLSNRDRQMAQARNSQQE